MSPIFLISPPGTARGAPKHWRRLKRLLNRMEKPLDFAWRAPASRIHATGAWDPGGWFRRMIERPAAAFVPHRVRMSQSRQIR